MPTISLEAEAGLVSQELAARGVAPTTRVHVTVALPDSAALPLAAAAQSGGAFAFLADEPDLYSDADSVGAVG
jgi:hypothetical protein